MNNKVLLGLALGLGALCGVAMAQVVAPQPANVGTSDLFQDVVGGQPTAQTQYVTAAQINGVIGYTQYITPSTGFTYTVGNSTSLLYLVPSATLATGTITLAANPGDGQTVSIITSQTQTAITINANTGQSLYTSNGVLATPTALTANTIYKWVYVKSQSAWFRIQ